MSETVYTHLAGDPHITVTAAEKWSRGMVQRLAEKYPDQVQIMCTNDDGSCVAHVPFFEPFCDFLTLFFSQTECAFRNNPQNNMVIVQAHRKGVVKKWQNQKQPVLSQ